MDREALYLLILNMLSRPEAQRAAGLYFLTPDCHCTQCDEVRAWFDDRARCIAQALVGVLEDALASAAKQFLPVPRCQSTLPGGLQCDLAAVHAGACRNLAADAARDAEVR